MEPSALFRAHFWSKATYALIWASEPVGANFTPVSSSGRAPPATESCTLAMVVPCYIYGCESRPDADDDSQAHSHFTDSDYVMDPDNRCSVSGAVFLFAGCPGA